MKRSDIITAIENRGYHVTAKDISKNNVILEALQFETENVALVFYTKDFTGATVDQAAEMIINAYEAHKAVNIGANLLGPDYIMKNVRIGLQLATKEDIIKKPCELDKNIEMFLFVSITIGAGEHGSFKLNNTITETAGLDIKKLWSAAKKNTFSDVDIQSLASLLGMPEEMMPEPLYVVTNTRRYRGAAGVLDKKRLKALAEKYNTKSLVILPSSIHECIVVPYIEKMSIDDLSEMVQAINGAEVDPVEQLADKAYLINF